jgi:hypothetical protein
MNDSLESDEFTETLLSTIRLQRHLGARVVISTQEPTISRRLWIYVASLLSISLHLPIGSMLSEGTLLVRSTTESTARTRSKPREVPRTPYIGIGLSHRLSCSRQW